MIELYIAKQSPILSNQLPYLEVLKSIFVLLTAWLSFSFLCFVSWLVIIILLAYMALVIVVLLNILIAQLSYTYSEAKKTAKLQYAIDAMFIVTRLEYSRLARWVRFGLLPLFVSIRFFLITICV